MWFAVKFDTEQLPSILNALELSNGDQKITLEVAVRVIQSIRPSISWVVTSRKWDKLANRHPATFGREYCPYYFYGWYARIDLINHVWWLCMLTAL